MSHPESTLYLYMALTSQAEMCAYVVFVAGNKRLQTPLGSHCCDVGWWVGLLKSTKLDGYRFSMIYTTVKVC